MTGRNPWQGPPGSNWGGFGPDDPIGRLNLLPPETVLAAAGCVEQPVYYNGYRARVIRNPEDRSDADETPLGIDRAARTGTQGRGVMVNLARRFASDRVFIDAPVFS
jgi:hypothetical protein